MSASDSTQLNTEPSSATELDDANLVAHDQLELENQEEISLDESAEREARENPLLPAYILAAKRALEAQDGVEEPLYLRRVTDNENIADRLRNIGFESRSESSTNAQYLPSLDYNLAAVKPVSDEVFKQHLFEFRKAAKASTALPHIKQKFIYFLKTHRSTFPEPTYIYMLRYYIQHNAHAITVDLSELHEFSPIFADAVVQDPLKFLDVMQDSLNQFVKEIERNAGDFQLKLVYFDKISKTFSTADINRISTIECQIISSSKQYIQLQKISVYCVACRSVMGLFDVNAFPKRCECGCYKLYLYPYGCLYSSYINIIMQLQNGEKRNAAIYGELISQLKPGSTVKLTGVWRIEQVKKALCSVYFHVLGAVQEDLKDSYNTEDLTAFQALASKFKSSDLDNLFIRSLYPAIFGHELLKQMLLITLLGGSQHSGTRENLHLLIIGDPGTAKSQFLKQTSLYAPKCMFAAGRGSSAAGLTVSVIKRGGEFYLQAGYMVLANEGVCCIDELDKMAETDRVAMHQAMEQYEVSITKAGIIATLPARCAVIAACNPSAQFYNRNLPLNANLNVGDALLSRFDLVYIVTDDHDYDERVADFITNRHAVSREEIFYAQKQLQNRQNLTGEQIAQYYAQLAQASQDRIPEEYTPSLVVQQVIYSCNAASGAGEALSGLQMPTSFIRAYIAHAKLTQPMISDAVAAKLRDFYVKVRYITAKYNSPITARYFSCLLRITEARAKLHFRKIVILEDADFACYLFARQLANQLKGGFQRRAEAEILALIRRFDDVAAGVLTKCFSALEIYNYNSGARETKVSVFYLQGECYKAGVELNQEFFNSRAFTDKYAARYDEQGQVVEIERRQ